MSKITFFVNGEKCERDSNQVKVGIVIELGAGGNISDYELQRRKYDGGPIVETCKDPEEIITIEDGTHFLTHFTGPVHVS